jgi:hypothetical protein
MLWFQGWKEVEMEVEFKFIIPGLSRYFTGHIEEELLLHRQVKAVVNHLNCLKLVSQLLKLEKLG